MTRDEGAVDGETAARGAIGDVTHFEWRAAQAVQQQQADAVARDIQTQIFLWSFSDHRCALFVH